MIRGVSGVYVKKKKKKNEIGVFCLRVAIHEFKMVGTIILQ